MFANANPVLEPGSTILVTGASGFIGSHITNQLLEAGYYVNGITRNLANNAWLTSLFETKYGKGKFTLYHAPDLTQKDTLHDILQGKYDPLA
jgi:nucleoside-diphosphate-sugar epimerase